MRLNVIDNHSRGMRPEGPVVVCVPIHDEETELPHLLDALVAQTACDFASVTLCVFLDGCSDGSADILRTRTCALPFAVVARTGARRPIANAGRARRAAMTVGRAALGGRDGLLLTTDADSMPASDWIMRSREALGFADVVAGRIVRRASEPSPLQDRLESYYDALIALRRRLDPVPWDSARPHHFTGGANLGFRRGAYDAVGGFRRLQSGEDARIVDDAERLGLRIRRDRASVVHTSSRREGRAPGGLAAHLRTLDRSPHLAASVSHPSDLAWQYRMQAQCRAWFEDAQFARIAARLSMPLDHIIGVARECANGQAFAMRIVPVPPGGIRQVTLDDAEAAVTVMEMRPIGRAA